jgi:hypothetical protein
MEAIRITGLLIASPDQNFLQVGPEEDRGEYGLSTGAVTDDRRHLGPKSSEIPCVLAIDVTINL